MMKPTLARWPAHSALSARMCFPGKDCRVSAEVPMDKSAGDELRDLAYTVVGFGVLGFQRLMVTRRDVEKAVTKGLNELSRRGITPKP